MAEGPLVERGVLPSSPEVWALAVRRAEVIGRLAQRDSVGEKRPT